MISKNAVDIVGFFLGHLWSYKHVIAVAAKCTFNFI